MFGTRLISGRIPLLIATTIVLASSVPVQVLADLAVPPNDGYITDTAKLLTAAQEQSLEADLTEYTKQTTNDIAVLIVPALNGADPEAYSIKVARQWKLGTVEHNNGLLIFIAYEDHYIRFETGQGLEGAVPDLVAKGIQETDMLPKFRDGDYYGGIAAAIDSLKKHIAGEYTADRYAEKSSGAGIGAYGFFMILVVLQWLLSILGRTKSWWLGGVLGGIGGLVLALMYGWWLTIPLMIVVGLFLDFIVSKNHQSRGPTSWWAGGGWGPGGGFGGGRGGGGGFGGFGGGGGFSGGGASSRW